SVTTASTSCNGAPTLTKSVKRYCPGPSTSAETGDETGLRNELDAPMATTTRKGAGDSPARRATWSAMGASSTAEVVFDRNMGAITEARYTLSNSVGAPELPSEAMR